jgi:hypothetical protein
VRCYCWNLIKGPLVLLYHLVFIVGFVDGVLHHGIRVRRSRVRASATHITLRIIIPTYRSPYGEACIVQTSEGGALAGTL